MRGLLISLLLGASLSVAVATVSHDRVSTVPFDLARAVATAEPGSTIRIPAGVHSGGVTIDKPVTLVGEAGAVLDGGGRGDVLILDAPGVTVRGLIIQSTGTSLDRENAGISILAPGAKIEDNELRDVLFGIYLKQAKQTIIRNNRIGGKDLEVQRRGDAIRVWYSDDVRIEDNLVQDSRDVVIWFSSRVQLLRNTVRRGRYGLHFMYSDQNVIEDNTLRDNSVGAFLMYSKRLVLRRNTLAYNRGPSGYGVGLKDMDGVEAADNLILGNRIGIYLDNSPSSVDIHDRYERNVFAFNDIGVAFQPSVRRNSFAGNTFLENVEQVAVVDAGELHGNSFTVEGRGNFWSDYQGYDLDDDGVGDLPHRPVSLFENLIDRQPKLRMFLYSPAQQAIELAARAFPTMRPQPKFTDSAPLMRPVAVAAAPPDAASAWPMIAAAGGLLLGSLTLLAGGRGGAGRRVTPAGKPSSTRKRESTLKGESLMLRVENLTKRYGRFAAVDDFSFELRQGGALALWGENGAGKTTVIRCLLGLVRFEGRIRVGGIDLLRDGKQVRRLVGYVPQELAFYDDMTGRQTLAFYGALKHVPLDRVETVLAEVGLAQHGDKPVAALSGGMKQRLALAAALLADPPLLVLDEMTSSLDAAARASLLSLLQRLRQQGKTVLYTSHRLEEIETLADRVLVMQAGRQILECGPHDLAERLRLRTNLKLHFAEGMVERAVEVLRANGYTTQRNGTGVWVEVQPNAKLEPIETLLAHEVKVRDFELAGQPTSADPEAGGGTE